MHSDATRGNARTTTTAETLAELPSVSPARPTVVALTVPDNSFFDRCMDILFRCAESADLALICQPINLDTLPTIPLTVNGNPQGYVLFRYMLAPLAKQLQDAGNRVVLVGAPPIEATPEVPTVYGDHEHGAYLAAKHLIDLGHQRIVFARLGSGKLQHQWRWRGHQRAVQEAIQQGKTLTAGVLSEEETKLWQLNPSQARTFFRRPDAPTGIIAWNDHEAARLLALLTRANIRVPDQVSLVGYDALPESKLVYPPLTTVDHVMEQQIRAAIDLLTRPTPPPESHTVVVTPTLVCRESTAPPPSL